MSMFVICYMPRHYSLSCDCENEKHWIHQLSLIKKVKVSETWFFFFFLNCWLCWTGLAPQGPGIVKNMSKEQLMQLAPKATHCKINRSNNKTSIRSIYILKHLLWVCPCSTFLAECRQPPLSAPLCWDVSASAAVWSLWGCWWGPLTDEEQMSPIFSVDGGAKMWFFKITSSCMNKALDQRYP